MLATLGILLLIVTNFLKAGDIEICKIFDIRDIKREVSLHANLLIRNIKKKLLRWSRCNIKIAILFFYRLVWILLSRLWCNNSSNNNNKKVQFHGMPNMGTLPGTTIHHLDNNTVQGINHQDIQDNKTTQHPEMLSKINRDWNTYDFDIYYLRSLYSYFVGIII